MKSPLEIMLPLLVFGLLFWAARPTYATTADQVVVQNNVDLSGVQSAISGIGSVFTDGMGTLNSTMSTVNGSITSLNQAILNAFTAAAKKAISGFNSAMLGLAQYLLSTNPNVDSMQNLWQSITLIISCFYLIILTIIGLKFLIDGHSIEGREKAKEWLKNTFMMIIGVNASFLLYKLTLETATAITQFIWITGFENLFNNTITASAGFILLIATTASVCLALITLFLRYVFLMLAVLLFPIGIFLYYTPNLRGWGKIIFNLIGMALFMQFIDVIVFVASNQVMTDLSGQVGQATVPALSFMLVAIINTIMLVYSVIKSALSTADQSPILGYALGAITGEMMATLKIMAAPKPAPREGNAVH